MAFLQRCVSALFVLQSISSTAQNERFYVNASNFSPNQTGKSWALAFADLQDALAASNHGDSIWVARGRYVPTVVHDRRKTFALPDGVVLLGGFLGNETTSTSRNWQDNPTILDGDIGVPNDSTDNSYNVLYLENPDSFTVVDGFTIQNGQADSITPTGGFFQRWRSGGGMFIEATDGEAYPLIRNCRFVHNTAESHGGAVCVNGAGDGSIAPQFQHCHFRQNRALLDGGAVYRRGSSWVERPKDFYDCIFVSNQAGRNSGAIHLRDAERTDTVDLVKCTISKCKAGLQAAAVNFDGVRSVGYTIKMDSMKVDSCRSNSIFFAIQIGLEPFYLVLISNSIFSNISSVLFYNNPSFGGDQKIVNNVVRNSRGLTTSDFIGMWALHDGTTISVINNTIEHCYSRSVWRIRADTVVFSGNQFSNNIQKDTFRPIIPVYGAGIIAGVFYNNIIEKNTIIDYPYFFLDCKKDIIISNDFISEMRCVNTLSTPPPIGQGKLYFINTCFDTDSIFYDFENKQTFQNISINNCYFGKLNCANLPPEIICGPNNIVGADPMFMDPQNGDYRLQSCSPLINAGANALIANNLTDFNGQPRIQDNIVDIGPFESPQLTGNLTALGPVCHQNSTGKIQFSLPNACLPAQLAWSKSDGQIGTDSLGLSAGVYAVTLTDGRGKTIADTLQILGSSPAVEVSGDSINCFGSSPAELSSTVSGGVDPLAFLWNTGQNESVIDDLSGGTFVLTVTDALGCTAVDSASVLETPPLGTSLAIVEASWAGGSNGAASVDVFAGLAPFSLLWSTGDTSKVVSGLAPGDYFLTVTDGAGCAEIYPFTISFGTSTDEATGGEIRFSPNPAADFVQIEWLGKGFSDRTELRFSNVLGEIVFETAFSSVQSTVRTADWTAGIYFAQLFENDILKKTARLVVAH